jgi:hypothetical protein
VRLLLLLITCALLAGCMKRVPAKKPPAPPPPAKVPVLTVRYLGSPSALIDPPPGSLGDKLPFDFPLNLGYGIEGSWRGPSQVKGTTGFERIGDFTVTKVDADVDPKAVAQTLEKWIASSGVRSTQSSGDGLQKTIEFGTDQTLGTISYSVRPDAPAKTVTFHLEVKEQPRSSR